MAAIFGCTTSRRRSVSRTCRGALVPIAVCLTCFTAAGCGSNELESPTALRLRGLAIVFMDYSVARGNGPKDEKTLLRHMGNVHETVLSTNNLDPKDPQLLISDRDQEPFVFRWGTGISFGQPNTPMLAHETMGKNGQRLVVFANGEIELVADERFKKLTEGSP